MSKASAAGSPSVPEQVAAVDLGSNSFHMVVARPAHGRGRIHDDDVRRGEPAHEPIAVGAQIPQH